jgi:hypothetical protein
MLIPYPVSGDDPLYQKTRRQVEQFKRRNPVQFSGILDRLEFALTDLDIYFDSNGELTTRNKRKV